MLLMKKSVLIEKKKNTTLVFLLSNCPQVLKPYMTDPDDFRIWLQGYQIEFTCLYISQGHSFMSTLRL